VSAYPATNFPPVASALASELTLHNWWGRTLLHIREGEERLQHLTGLSLGIQLEMGRVNERIGELREHSEKLEKATKMYEEMQKTLQGVKQKELDLQGNIDQMEDNPVVMQAISTQKKLQQHPPKSMQQRTSPLGITPIRCNSAPPKQSGLSRPPLDDDSSDDGIDSRSRDPDTPVDDRRESVEEFGARKDRTGNQDEEVVMLDS